MPAVSIASQLRNTFVTGLGTIAFVGLPLGQSPKIVGRKRPERRENDTAYTITVSVARAKREMLTAEDNADVISDDVQEQNKELIEKYFLQPQLLASVPGVTEVVQKERPIFSVGGLDQNYDYTPVVFGVQVVESR
jgi:hypothetical protein